MRKAAPCQQVDILEFTESQPSRTRGVQELAQASLTIIYRHGLSHVPDELVKSLFSNCCLAVALPEALTQQPGTPVLGCQIQLGVLARLETRQATPDRKLERRETAAVGSRRSCPGWSCAESIYP